jgi:hypothetical protein
MQREMVAIRIFSDYGRKNEVMDYEGKKNDGCPTLRGFRRVGFHKGLRRAKRYADEGLPTQSRLPKLRRRAPVSLTKRSAEMTVTGKSQLQTQSSEVIILRKKIEGSCQPQP